MRVLLLGWEYPPFNSGGLGTACEGLVKGLSKLNVDVTVVLPQTIPLSLDYCTLHFLDVCGDANQFSQGEVEEFLYSPYGSVDKKSSRYSISTNGISKIRPMHGSLQEKVFMYAQNVVEDIDKLGDFDVIHAHDWLTVPAGIALKKATGKPLVVHIHATEFDRTGGTGVNQLVYDIERAGMEAADRVCTVSHWTKCLLLREYGIPESKVDVVHNGVDGDVIPHRTKQLPFEYLKESGAKIVLFVGRITIQKGPDYFLEMAVRVLEHEPKAFFIFAGSGDMEGQLIKKAAELGISDDVLFTGFLRGEELYDTYRAADILIMPSVSEPFGIVPLESLLVGTPVLVSKQSGASEVIPNALKVDFWDVDEMANQVITLVRHDSLKDTLAENGYIDAKQSTWQKAAQVCRGVYNKVCKKS